MAVISTSCGLTGDVGTWAGSTSRAGGAPEATGGRAPRAWAWAPPPAAVANMQSITQTFGPSHKAFLIVPMVGAFFVDLINAAILSGFVNVITK